MPETFLTTQLTYAFTLSPARLANVHLLYQATFSTALFVTLYLWLTSTLGTNMSTFLFDEFSACLKLFVLFTALYFLSWTSHSGSEASSMVVLATLFLLLLLSANQFIATFFCVVGFSLNLYILVLLDAPYAAAREAGIKYYYLSTFSSGLILFGIFMLFLLTESVRFEDVAAVLSLHLFDSSLLAAAIGFLLFGFSFKLSAFPGHQWAPEVYEGSPTPIMGYFMLPVKIAVLGCVMRILSVALAPAFSIWQPLLIGAAIGSLIWGCFGALYTLKVRHFLAYASINQMGFLLIGLACGTLEGYRATLIYLVLYVVMSLAFLNIFLHIVRTHDSQTPLYVTDLRGLHPAAAWTLTVTLFSMAGIPPLAGFFGKYYLLLHALESAMTVTVIVALATSLVTTFYYLRLIKSLNFDAGHSVLTLQHGWTSHLLEALLWAFGCILAPVLLVSTHLVATLGAVPLQRLRPAFLAGAVSPSLGALGLVSAAAVALLPNPIHSLLSLMGAFLALVGVYMSIQAQFISFTFLIVYVGAVAILFLFVVMLLNVRELSQAAQKERTGYLETALAFLLLPVGMLLCKEHAPQTEFAAFTHFVTFEYQDVNLFGSLYEKHAALFVAIALILLATMVGVIVIAKPQHAVALAAVLAKKADKPEIPDAGEMLLATSLTGVSVAMTYFPISMDIILNSTACTSVGVATGLSCGVVVVLVGGYCWYWGWTPTYTVKYVKSCFAPKTPEPVLEVIEPAPVVEQVATVVEKIVTIIETAPVVEVVNEVSMAPLYVSILFLLLMTAYVVFQEFKSPRALFFLPIGAQTQFTSWTENVNLFGSLYEKHAALFVVAALLLFAMVAVIAYAKPQHGVALLGVIIEMEVNEFPATGMVVVATIGAGAMAYGWIPCTVGALGPFVFVGGVVACFFLPSTRVLWVPWSALALQTPKPVAEKIVTVIEPAPVVETIVPAIEIAPVVEVVNEVSMVPLYVGVLLLFTLTAYVVFQEFKVKEKPWFKIMRLKVSWRNWLSRTTFRDHGNHRTTSPPWPETLNTFMDPTRVSKID